MMELTRRHFIHKTAFLAGMTLMSGLRILGDTIAESRKRFGGWDFGLQAHSLREFPIEEAIEIIDRQLNLRWVEFSRAHLPLVPLDRGNYPAPAVSVERIREVKRLLARHNLGMRAHGVNQFEGDADANRRVFVLAKELGIRNLTAGPTQDAFDSLERLVEEFDIRIAIHNHGPGSGFPTTEALAEALEKRHRHIGVCLDTGHSLRSGDDPVEAVHILKGRIYGVHLKDMAEREGDLVSVPVGAGQLDIEAFFRALKKAKVPADAALSLEFEGESADPVLSLQQCLESISVAARKAAS
jgi:sugar phosphate isomerase/epimerase